MCRRGARLSGQWGRSVCRQKEHSCAWKSCSMLSILTAATQLWSLHSRPSTSSVSNRLNDDHNDDDNDTGPKSVS
jgi:hypothetical protein